MPTTSLYTKIPPQTRRLLLVLAAAGFIIGVGCSTVFRAGFDIKLRTDLTVYRAAGVGVLEGQDLYTVENERSWFYTSPPIVALMCIPLAWANITWDAFFVYLISTAMLFALAALARKLIPPEAKEHGIMILASTFFLSSIFLADVLTRGQFGILLLLALMISLYGWLKDRKAVSGIALGFAVAAKVTPAALVFLFFLLKKEFRIALWAAAAFLFFGLFIPGLVFGLPETVAYLNRWLDYVPLSVYDIPPSWEMFYSGDYTFWRQIHDPFIYRNQSLYAVLARIILGSREHLVAQGIALPRLLAMAASMVMFSISAAILLRRRKPDTERMLEFSIPVIVLLVGSTLAWTHYFSCLFIAYFACIVNVFTTGNIERKKVLRRTIAASAILILLGYAIKPLSGAGFLLWGACLLWAGMLRALYAESP